MRTYLLTLLPLLQYLWRIRRQIRSGRRTIPGWGKGPIRLPRPINRYRPF